MEVSSENLVNCQWSGKMENESPTNLRVPINNTDNEVELCGRGGGCNFVWLRQNGGCSCPGYQGDPIFRTDIVVIINHS